MTTRFTQAADEMASGIGLLREGAPDAAKAFGSLALAATTSRALDAKTKELMALAISIAVHCEGASPTTHARHTSMAPPVGR